MLQKRTTNTIKAEPNSSYRALPKSEADEVGDRWEVRRWVRSFLWLWVASAVIWVVVVGLFALSDSHSQERWELAGWAFIPPVCALAAVLALVWIRRGFRARSK
jgi:sterol desaturase/sphingolipid hydroxylase (fatty acid hydroxylase superfamily)